ncbi:hypothetical protein LPJ59_004164 [Coemansia sp. RSA 2399]|nr:hypothetical protein LPJ59_004164 [Coemansia sp. RSA 2399]
MSTDSVLSFGPQPSQYNAQKYAARGGSPMSRALGGSGGGDNHRGPNHQEEGNGHELDINRTPPLGSDTGSCTQCAEESPDATRGNNTAAGPVYTQAAYDTMSSGPQPYRPLNQGSVAAGPAAARPRPPQQQQQQQFAPGTYPSPMAYGQGTAPGAAQLYTPVSMSNPSMYNQPQQQPMPVPGPQYQQSPPQQQQQHSPPQQQQQQQQYATGNSSNSSLYGPQPGPQAPPPPRQEAETNAYYGPSSNNNLKSVSSGFSYNTAFNTAANAMAGGAGAVNNGSVASSVLPGPYNNASANMQQQQHQQHQQPAGFSPSTYAPSLAGVSAYDANQTSTQPMYVMEDPVSTTSRVTQAGKIALGALAAGAVGYGVHNIMDQHLSSGDKTKASPKKQEMERQRQEVERQRREAEARLRREEEEQRRRDEYERWRRDEEVRRKQQEALNMQYKQQQYGYAPPHLQRPDSVSSHHSHQSDGSFAPPAPFGRPPYSYNPNDVRHPDPTRSSENSPTPQTYPELRQSPSDPVIKIGTLIALKHAMTSRFLHSDRSHSTVSGSNQQLVYANRHNTDENDWWQVLPANHEVPVPGSIVAYGTQIRLRHVQTGRHLHSQYMFRDRMGNNEVSAYGDQTLSDECDHWVVERWGEGAYNQTWKSTDAIVLRHYVSGMALHSHDVMLRDNVQSVVCSGNGTSENAKWRLTLTK